MKCNLLNIFSNSQSFNLHIQNCKFKINFYTLSYFFTSFSLFYIISASSTYKTIFSVLSYLIPNDLKVSEGMNERWGMLNVNFSCFLSSSHIRQQFFSSSPSATFFTSDFYIILHFYSLSCVLTNLCVW